MDAELEELARQVGCSVADLEAAISQSGSLPEMERARYRKRGFTIIEPDAYMGVLMAFTPQDWLPASFLAVKDKEVQIALIASRVPGSGAFSRLLARLDAQHYRVRVVAPLPKMAAILRCKGFKPQRFGSTFEDAMDIWERA